MYYGFIKLRLAVEDDFPELMALIGRVVPVMLAAGNRQWDESYPDEAAFRSDIDRSQLWVAEVSGSLAGIAAISMNPEPEYAQAGLDVDEAAVVVHRLAVDPVFRGRGVAAALMQQAERVAVENGITTLRVDTNTENAATKRLFPKLGYRLAGEISLKVRPELRFFCYEKRLPPN